jgi:branched-chain amino acid transport system substrate-binding protein
MEGEQMKKRTKWKNFVAFVLIAAMLLLCMAGCSNQVDTSSQAGDGADGKTIKIGYVAPFTGVNSDCVTSTRWGNALYLEQINEVNGGIEVDGQKCKVEIIYRDSQSDVAVAGEVATQLVLDEKVDLLVGAWTPNTTVPVAAVAERYQVPCICPNSPAQAWKAGLDEGTDYKWSVGIMFDFAAFIGEVVNLWDTLDFNKKIGLMLDNGTDGATAAMLVGKIAQETGYTLIDPGRYPVDTNDYSSMINLFIKEDMPPSEGFLSQTLPGRSLHPQAT